MHYGHLFRAIRKHRKITQSEMGEMLGLDRTVISRLERSEVGLFFDRAMQWFEITQSQKILELLSKGVEVAVIIDSLSTLLGGLILWV